MSGIRISPTRVTSESQKAASSSFICLHNAAKDSGLRGGGAALLTCPAAPLRPSGLAVKRPLEKNRSVKYTGLLLSRLSAGPWSTDFSPLSTTPGENPSTKAIHLLHCTCQMAGIPLHELFCKPHLSVCLCNYKSVRRRMASVQLVFFAFAE